MEDQNKEKDEKISSAKNVQSLAKGIFYYNSISILGPLLVFIGTGLLLDKLLDTKPYLTVTGLIIAFLTSNLLILRRVKRLTQEAKEYNTKTEEQKNDTSAEVSTKEEETLNN